jgi:hypothetical protein
VTVVDLRQPQAPRRIGDAGAGNVLRLFAAPGGRVHALAKVDDSDEEPYQLRTYQVAPETPTAWTIVGSIGLPSGTSPLVGRDGVLLTGDGAGRLARLDGARGVPAAAGGVALAPYVLGWPAQLATDGRFVYVLDRASHRLEVLRVTGADRSERLGGLALDGAPDVADMVAARGRLYLVSSDGGLVAVDVGDPTAPRLAGAWPAWSGEVLAASGGVLFVGARSGDAGGDTGGLTALGIDNPDRPVARGRLADLDVVDLAPLGAVLHVTTTCPPPDDGAPCLATVGTGNPDQLQLLATAPLTPARVEPGAVAVTDGFAFASFGPGAALRVFDVSSPVSPRPAGQFADNRADEARGGPYHLAAGADRLFFGDAYGLRLIDPRSHAAPALERRFPFPPFGALDLAVGPSQAYVLADDGVWVVERAP